MFYFINIKLSQQKNILGNYLEKVGHPTQFKLNLMDIVTNSVYMVTSYAIIKYLNQNY